MRGCFAKPSLKHRRQGQNVNVGGPRPGIISGTAEDETLDGAGGEDILFGNKGANIVTGETRAPMGSGFLGHNHTDWVCHSSLCSRSLDIA